MFGVLRFSATATLADVVRGIQRTPARRIALVFPLGAHVSLAEIGRMGVVDLICREQRKEATIVGGDAQLRAHAVAVGLRAAMTVEDWRAMRTPRGTWLSWRPKPRPAEPVRLTLLPTVAAGAPTPIPNAQIDDALAEETDPQDEVPTHIRELLAMHGHELTADPSRYPFQLPLVARHSTIAYDLDRDDDLRDLWERDEQRLTATIRRSSGHGVDALAVGWGSAMPVAFPDD